MSPSGLNLDTRNRQQTNSLLIDKGLSSNLKIDIFSKDDNTLEIKINDHFEYNIKLSEKLKIKYLQDCNNKIAGKQFISKYNVIYSQNGQINSILYRNALVENFKNIFLKSIHERHILYLNGCRMIKDYPFFGCGRGCFSYSYLNYREIDQKLEAWIHSDPLQHIVERGFIGLSFYLIIGIFLLHKIYKVSKFELKNNFTIIIGLLSLGIFALLDFPFDSFGIKYCAALFMQLLILTPKSSYSFQHRPS